MKKILVMLSSYNGEKYIREQIDSILNQEDVDLDLLIRDDGSKDTTPDILDDYSQNYPNVQIYKEQNIGCKRSFFKLLKLASDSEKSYDYYAFSDQDDVWLNNKCISAIKELSKSSNHFKLYSSVPINVDENLNRLPQKNFFYNNDTLGSNIISSHVQGSTAVFSRELLLVLSKSYEIIMSLPVNMLPYHDAYLALAAYALDSYIVSDINGYLLYRQHVNNLVGGKGQNLINAQMDRLKNPYRRFTKVRIFLSTIDHSLLTQENLDLLQKCANVNLSLANRLKIIFDKRLRTGSIKHNLFFWFNILIKRW